MKVPFLKLSSAFLYSTNNKIIRDKFGRKVDFAMSSECLILVLFILSKALANSSITVISYKSSY